MTTMLDLIQKIRQMPAMIGRPWVSNLYAYLNGFAYARKERKLGDYDFLSAFGDYVHQRYEITSVQSWAQIIGFFSTTEEEEKALFWNLLDEFLAQREKQKLGKKKESGVYSDKDHHLSSRCS